jgi:hypothetical protein
MYYDPRTLRMQARRQAKWEAEFAGKADVKIGLVGKLELIWKGLTAALLSILSVVGTTLVIVLLIKAITDKSITIAPISVPKEMVEKGYTPEVVANKLQSAIKLLVENTRKATHSRRYSERRHP